MRVAITNGWLELDSASGAQPEVPPEEPEEPETQPEQPAAKKPFFRVGSASGKAGERVAVEVYGGCANATSGFHFGMGCGNWTITPEGVDLGPYFRNYLGGKVPFEIMTYFGADRAVGPSAFMEYAMGLWVMEGGEWIGAIPIPFDTLLFTVHLDIPAGEPVGVHELIAKDLYWSTQDNAMKRNYEFTASPSAWTDIVMMSGSLEVVA